MTMKRILGALVALCLGVGAPQADAPAPVSVAVLNFGTVNWLTDAITHHGLDAAQGVRLETIALAGRDAATIAFQAGEVDLFVADWLWVLNQRDRGKDFRFFPYSRSLGALMAMPASGVRDLCDLKGRTLGVVGGALDKSWLVYRALARRDCGFDLADETRTLFGAPPLMSRQLTDGAVEAVSTYWHFAARLRALGAARVIDVTEALAAMDIAPAPPLIGFVWSPARTDPEIVAALSRAVKAAGALMKDSDAEWVRLRPLMRAEDDAAFLALRDAYRDGIIDTPWTAADTAAAAGLHATLVAAGGARFARDAGTFDPAAFPDPGAN